MVRQALREQGVACMVPEAEIQVRAQQVQPGSPSAQPARGPRPTARRGPDGRIELLIDPEPDVPMPALDGSIDFKEFSFFRTVPKGARLARSPAAHPRRTRHERAWRRGAAAAGPALRQAARTQHRVARARIRCISWLTASGRLAMRVGVPEVVEVLDVAGDVSLKTGNIEFPGAVSVAGDVHSRMQIKSVGDVEVVGTVEDSIIRSDGAIVIKGGVNGSGRRHHQVAPFLGDHRLPA